MGWVEPGQLVELLDQCTDVLVAQLDQFTYQRHVDRGADHRGPQVVSPDQVLHLWQVLTGQKIVDRFLGNHIAHAVLVHFLEQFRVQIRSQPGAGTLDSRLDWLAQHGYEVAAALVLVQGRADHSGGSEQV